MQITASCSLKRLQYWFWDPGLAVSQNMVAQAMAAATNPDDGGVSNAVIAILQNVVGWPATKVHIAGIPQNWVTWAYKIAQAVQAETAEADALAQQFYATLGAGGTVGGTTGGGDRAVRRAEARDYGGQRITSAQAAIAVTIYNVACRWAAPPGTPWSASLPPTRSPAWRISATATGPPWGSSSRRPRAGAPRRSGSTSPGPRSSSQGACWPSATATR